MSLPAPFVEPLSRSFPAWDVSVVIPSHRRPSTARVAVASALAQTAGPREVLLVVDGADTSAYDGFENLISDPRLRVLRPGAQLGPSGVRNLGVKEAQGSYIAFLDDDDVWLPVKLERQFDLLVAQDLLDGPFVCTTAIVAVDPGNATRWPERDPQPGESVADFLFGLGPAPRRGRVLQTSTFLTTRAHALSVPMRGRAFEDWDWLVRATQSATYVHVPEQLVVFHRSDGTLSSQLTIEEGETWLEELRPFISDEAYAAACLTALSRRAACVGTPRDMARLVGRSFRGKPRVRDLFEFPLRIASMWPERRSLRAARAQMAAKSARDS